MPTLDTRSAVTTAAAGTAGLLAILAVYSPKHAVYALLGVGFVALAMSRLPLAIAAFTVLTFPAHLPGSLGVGATLAKPVGALLVLAWGAAVLTQRAEVPLLPRAQPALFSAVVGLLVFSGASMLWAVDSGAARTGAERLALNAALLVVAYTAACTRSGFRTIVYGYLVASVVTSTYSIASGHYIAAGRLGGLFDPNYFAAELIPAIVIAAFLFATTASARMRWLYAAVAGVDLAAFALTQSRGGIVGLAVGLLAAVAVAGRARPRILALVLLLAAIGLGYYFGYKPAHVFQTSSRAGLSGTTSGRVDEWRVALRVYSTHPIGGVGLGNYQVVEPSYTTQTINISTVQEFINVPLVVHNTYLQFLSELGLIGLFLFLAVAVIPLRVAGRALRRLKQPVGEIEFAARGLVAGVIGLLTAYVFLSGELEKPLWLLLALLASVPTVLREAESEELSPQPADSASVAADA
jgi:O-antigen ligase